MPYLRNINSHFKKNKMNKRILIIIGLVIIISLKSSFADCLACWELKYVKITLTNNHVTEGYIQWSELWLRIKNPENKQFESFHEKYIFTMESWNWKNSILYEQIFEFKEHLPARVLVASNNLIDTISVSAIRDIEILKKDNSNFTGAGDILGLDSISIELLDKEPISWYRDGGSVSETLFLSYNEKINKDQLIEISRESGYWLKRKSYESEGVLIIMISWD